MIKQSAGEQSVPGKRGLVKSAISARGDELQPINTYDYDQIARAKQLVRINDRPVTIRTYARRLDIRVKAAGTQSPPPQTKRGKIVEFSRKSRKRMLDLVHQIRNVNDHQLWFITLTYPGHFTSTAKQVKDHLRALTERLRRKYPTMGFIWRLELKRRLSGASQGYVVPHYHLVLFGVGAKHKFLREWLSEAWYEIVGSGDVDHLNAGTNVRRCKSLQHVVNYVSKYAAKCDDDYDEFERSWGRRWGVRGEIDAIHLHTIKLSRREYTHFHRLMRRWLKSVSHGHAERYRSFGSWRGASIYGVGDVGYYIMIMSMVGHARELARNEE